MYSDPITEEITAEERERLILVSALQVDRAVLFSTAIIVAAFIPLFTMQGVEGQIFGPMARTYAYALVGALAVRLARSITRSRNRRARLLRTTVAYEWLLRHRLGAVMTHDGILV